jgi:hypothetical protein
MRYERGRRIKEDFGEFHEADSTCCEKYGLTSVEPKRTGFSSLGGNAWSTVDVVGLYCEATLQ